MLDIIKSIAKYNITTQQLKKIFRLLHTQGNHRARYSNQILVMLNELYEATDSSRPDHSFLLTPSCSGIKVVSMVRNQSMDGILRFPNVGFTISLWFNVASFLANWIMDGEFGIPHLFSVITDTAAFLVFIQDASLVIKYYQNGKEVTIPATNLPISENRWYHLLITQQNNRMGKPHPLTVMLDGNCSFEYACPYPVFTSSPKIYIGTRGVDLAYTNIPTTYTDFNGEIGTVYLLNRAIDKRQAKGIHLLGPNYMFNFETLHMESFALTERRSFSKEELDTIRSVCDGSLTPSILVNLSACVLDKEQKVIDNTPPQYRQQKWLSSVMGVTIGKDSKDLFFAQHVNGVLLAGTHVSSTRQISTMLDSLGGIKLLFPLLPQLDLLEPDADEAAFGVSPAFTSECYSLLGQAVVSNAGSQRFMLQHNGFGILAYLLQKTSPENLTELLLNQMVNLLQNAELSRELHEQIFKAFFYNPGLWIYTSASLQEKVYGFLLDILKSNDSPELVSIVKNVGIEGFCFILRYFYSDMEIEISEELADDRDIIRQWLTLDDEFKHPLSGEVVGKKPTQEEKAAVRKVLMEIITTLIQDRSTITKATCFNLAYCILWCQRNKDHELLLAFIDLLNQILHMEGMGAFFIESMAGFSHVSLDVAATSMTAEEQSMPVVENRERLLLQVELML